MARRGGGGRVLVVSEEEGAGRRLRRDCRDDKGVGRVRRAVAREAGDWAALHHRAQLVAVLLRRARRQHRRLARIAAAAAGRRAAAGVVAAVGVAPPPLGRRREHLAERALEGAGAVRRAGEQHLRAREARLAEDLGGEAQVERLELVQGEALLDPHREDAAGRRAGDHVEELVDAPPRLRLAAALSISIVSSPRVPPPSSASTPDQRRRVRRGRRAAIERQWLHAERAEQPRRRQLDLAPRRLRRASR